jgi:PAS domain-containing protein
MFMADGFVMHEIIRDESGSPVDYRFLEVNPAFVNMAGLSRNNLIGRTMRRYSLTPRQKLIQHFGRYIRRRAVRFCTPRA